MASYAGLRGTGDWSTSERLTNFREMILFSNPNGSAPLTALMARMRKQSVDDPEFSWWEEALGQNRVTINYTTGYDSTVNTIIIDSGGLALVAGDVLLIERTEDTSYANEIVIVSSVTSDTVIVIKRGQAGTTKADVSGVASGLFDGNALTKIGTAFAEGTGSPDVTIRNPSKKHNYCQIFKTAVEETRTAMQTRLRTGNAWENDKKRRSFDHSVALEYAFMWGKHYEVDGGIGTSPKPLRYTGGLREFITTNVTIFTTTPTEDTLLNALYPVFNYNSEGSGNERIVLAGNGALNSLNRLARNSTNTRINFDNTIKFYGMELQKWITPQGTFLVKTHPLMNLHAKFANSMFVINPPSLIYRPMMDTKFQDNIQHNDADCRKGQWISECGLEVHHEETMAYIGNFVV
jgi:hypothetical protein